MVLAFIIGAASVGFAYCWCACLASVLRGWSSWPEIVVRSPWGQQ
jgi:hypothetical protein